MNIDPSTGLPEVPYTNSYWRVQKHEGISGSIHYYMELRAKKKVFFGLREKDWKIREHIMLELTKPEMILRATQILEKIEKEKLNLDLLGDYPPKSING